MVTTRYNNKILGLVLGFAAFWLLVGSTWAAPEQKYQAFLDKAFESKATDLKPQVFWLKKEFKQELKQRFNYDLPGLRLRYWQQGAKSAWILDEVGKEQPITMGFVVEDQKINFVDVLEYRESRGGEIQYPFFTKQFKGLSLNKSENKWQLSEDIDGITGATLSVRAMTKVAQVALYLDEAVRAGLEP